MRSRIHYSLCINIGAIARFNVDPISMGRTFVLTDIFGTEENESFTRGNYMHLEVFGVITLLPQQVMIND